MPTDFYRRILTSSAAEVVHAAHLARAVPAESPIGTTAGVIVVGESPLSEGDALTMAAKRVAKLLPGGMCEAIPLAARTLISTRWATRDLRVFSDVSPEAGFAASLGLLPDEVIRTVELAKGSKITTLRKVTIQAPKAIAETRFFIVDPVSTDLPVWDTGFASQSAARAELTGRLPKSVVIGGEFVPARDDVASAFEIISMTRRVDGSALVTATCAPLTHTATYDVVIDQYSPLGLQAGWLFYGRVDI